MPWLEDKDDVVRSRINVSSSKARYANTPEARTEIASGAASYFSEGHLAEAVFTLAATMAHSDLVLHDREITVLNSISKALKINCDRAEELIEATG